MGLSVAYYVFMAFFWYAVVSCIWVILQENRNPVRAIAWILILLFIPVLGLLLYAVFGRSYYHQGRMARKIRSLIAQKQQLALDRSQEAGDNPLLLKHRQVIQLMGRTADAALFGNNDVVTYTDGKALFDAMIRDIEAAQDHIHMEYYILDDDATGMRFIEALIAKAQQGIEVRIICDAVGSMHLARRTRQQMRAAGVRLYSFSKIRFPFFTGKLNYRNHRKILIVDGEVAYLGGFNVADRYTKGLEWGTWRDTHIRLRGDAVAGMQNIFLSDWLSLTGILLTTDRYFPAAKIHSNSYMQVVRSGPDRDWQTLMMGFCEVLYNASSTIDIQTPYFLPNESVLLALQTAALSGVTVRLMLPARSDSKLSYAASMSYIKSLLDAGVRVYCYEKGFIHAKTLVVDGDLSIVGSANMDYRSFEQNFEVAAFVYDKGTAEQLTQAFQRDLRHCHRIHRKLWVKRSVWIKLADSIARLFSPVL